MLLFSFLLCFFVQAKTQKDFEFELKEGKSIDVPFKLEKEYIVLYVRPENEMDDLGEIQFKSNSDTTTILDFYETAILNTKGVNLKCIIEPYIGRITILSLDPIDITTTIITLTLTQQQPVQLVSLYNNIILFYSIIAKIIQSYDWRIQIIR